MAYCPNSYRSKAPAGNMAMLAPLLRSPDLSFYFYELGVDPYLDSQVRSGNEFYSETKVWRFYKI